MLLYNAISKVLERKGADDRNIPNDITFIKSSTGEIINCTQIRVLSFDSLHITYMMQFPNGQIRSIKKISIIKINNHDIILK